MNEKKLQLYQQILNSSEEIRKEIMSSISDIILFGGQISDEDNRELSSIAKITGDTFQSLIDRGAEFYEVPNKKDFVAISINGNEYLCHTSVISSFQKKTNFLNNSEQNNVEQNVINDTLNKEVVPIVEPKTDMIDMSFNIEQKENDIEKQIETTPNPVLIEEPTQETKTETTEVSKEETIEPENVVHDEVEPVEESVPVEEKSEEISTNEKENMESHEVEQSVNNETEKNSDVENIEMPMIANEKEELTASNTTTIVSQFSRNNMFIEEKRKDFDEFIYDSYRITVMHSFGGKPEEMQVMIAPLKIQKYSCTTVPILVSIYYKGRTYTKSSYDIQEEGKNLVQIDVNEYYFLCRGSFDDDGNFNSVILTTGPSANQGDKINILSRKKYGNSKRANTNNGHIKFRYTADEGPGTIEVFPLEVGEQDFVIIAKNDEFIDYLAISPNGYNKPFVYEDGVKKEILCNWDGDTLEVELLEG